MDLYILKPFQAVICVDSLPTLVADMFPDKDSSKNYIISGNSLATLGLNNNTTLFESVKNYVNTVFFTDVHMGYFISNPEINKVLIDPEATVLIDVNFSLCVGIPTAKINFTEKLNELLKTSKCKLIFVTEEPLQTGSKVAINALNKAASKIWSYEVSLNAMLLKDRT